MNKEQEKRRIALAKVLEVDPDAIDMEALEAIVVRAIDRAICSRSSPTLSPEDERETNALLSIMAARFNNNKDELLRDFYGTDGLDILSQGDTL